MKIFKFTFLFSVFFIFNCYAQQPELVKKEIKEENKKLNYSINVSYSLIKDAVTSSQKNYNTMVEGKVKSGVDNFKKEMETWESYNKENEQHIRSSRHCILFIR